MWKIFNDKPGRTRSVIKVEIRIIVLISDRYVNEIIEVSVPKGSTLKHLLKTAWKQRNLEKNVYDFVRGLKPPLSIILNGTPVEDSDRKTLQLADGDKITLFTPVSGG